MGVRFLRFDILPNNPVGELEELDEVGEELGGVAMQEDDQAFCLVVEPGNAGRR